MINNKQRFAEYSVINIIIGCKCSGSVIWTYNWFEHRCVCLTTLPCTLASAASLKGKQGGKAPVNNWWWWQWQLFAIGESLWLLYKPCWSTVIGQEICWLQALSTHSQDVQGDAILCSFVQLYFCVYFILSVDSVSKHPVWVQEQGVAH